MAPPALACKQQSGPAGSSAGLSDGGAISSPALRGCCGAGRDALANGRASTAFAIRFKADTMAADPEPGSLTDRSDMQAKRAAAVGVQGRARIVACCDQPPAQFQDRRDAMYRDAECAGAVGAAERGDNRLAHRAGGFANGTALPIFR